MTLQEIIDEVYEKHDAECLRLTKERDEAIEQRDEARIWWLKGYYQDWKSEAKSRGWDCFKTKEETP